MDLPQHTYLLITSSFRSSPTPQAEAVALSLDSVRFESDVLGESKPVIRKREVFVLSGDDLEGYFGLGAVINCEGRDEEELREVVEYYRDVRTRQVEYPEGANEDHFWGLVKGLLNPEVDERLGKMGVDEVLGHEFFTESDELFFLAEMDEEDIDSLGGSGPGMSGREERFVEGSGSRRASGRGKAGGAGNQRAFKNFKDAMASWEASHGERSEPRKGFGVGANVASNVGGLLGPMLGPLLGLFAPYSY